MRDPDTRVPAEVGSDDHLLARLVGDIQRTRGVLRELLDRSRPGNATQLLQAREESRAALEVFVAALVERRLPVPRQIHDELALMRRLCNHTRAPYRDGPSRPG